MGENFYTLGLKYYQGYQMPLFIRKDHLTREEAHLEYYKLLVALSKSEIIINKKKYNFESPTVVFLNDKDVIHSFQGDVTVIFFLPSLINKVLTVEKMNENRNYIVNLDDCSYLIPFLRDLEKGPKVVELTPYYTGQVSRILVKMEHQLIKQPDNFWPCRSKSYLIEILFSLCYPIDEDDQPIENEEDVIDQIVSYIQNHISESISIADIAKEFNINRTTLDEKFVKHLRVTPLKYINTQRIELSKVILVNTAVPVTEVSGRVGVNSPAYFSKIFRDSTGLSPSQFRQKACNVEPESCGLVVSE